MSQLRSLLSKAKSQVLLARVGGGESGGRRSFKQFREDISRKLNEIPDPKGPKNMGAATRELAVGFDKDVKSILEKLPPKRQSMMFSATMPMPFGIRKLTQKHLKDPLVPYMQGQSRFISFLGHSRQPRSFDGFLVENIKVFSSRSIQTMIFSVYLVFFASMLGSYFKPNWFGASENTQLKVSKTLNETLPQMHLEQKQILATVKKIEADMQKTENTSQSRQIGAENNKPESSQRSWWQLWK